MTPIPIHGVVPAAGQSRRMRGVDKLLVDVDGQSLLRRSIVRLRAAGVVRVVVVIDQRHPLRHACINDLDIEILTIAPSTPALSLSLQAGVQVAREDCGGLLIHLPDMPDITTRDIDTLLAAHSASRIVRAATTDDRPGHPVLVPCRHFHLFASLRGDQGLGRIIEAEAIPTTLIPLAGERSRCDLDTPEDWRDWRAT